MPLKKIDLDDCFPKAESKPITVREALSGVVDRNKLTDRQREWWEKTPIGKSASKVHPHGHWFNFIKLNPDNVCNTIPKGAGNAKMVYWDSADGLSIRGYMRVCSFLKILEQV